MQITLRLIRMNSILIFHCRSVGMVQSPSSSLNTPIGAGAVPSPVGDSADDHAYREKVRQLSKYIEPLRKMIERMVNDGESMLDYYLFILY